MDEPRDASASTAASTEFSFHLMDALSANLKDAEARISRQLVLITILGALFVVLARGQVGEIVFEGIPISTHYFVQAFIPITIAALYLSTVNTIQMAIQIVEAHVELVEQFRQNGDEGIDQRILWPSTGAFATLAALPVLTQSYVTRWAVSIGSRTRYLLYLAAPVGVVIYAIWFLLAHRPGPLQYTAVIVSSLMILQPLTLLISIVPSIARLSSGKKANGSGRDSLA